ncbi:MAG: excinuclease ABC subunit UvrA [Spirochaetales bacterium]|jgi:excinuclease ABC subunit A|nr:excinuclease ABC subunit UvrA [Spirochaetales bacterium]
MKKLIIKGAREHNLKNIDLELPRDKLVVISGLSGSGKSSLAFDTIYAEGQRRYVESLSAYARQFLGRMEKPDVDYIEGLSPAISIEQKTTHRNPRSTVGTVTEIFDYYRLLYARIGIPHCPKCGREVHEQSVDQIIDTILAYPPETRISLLAPVVREKKGEHEKIIEDARKAGFVRIRLDKELRSLDEEFKLDKKKKHSLEILVDRLKIAGDIRRRLSDSVETALEVGEGQMICLIQDPPESSGEAPPGEGGASRQEFFSQKNSCSHCSYSLPELQPRLFSFNNPQGACPECTGLGMTLEFDPALICPDPGLSINGGGILTHNPAAAWNRSLFESLSRHFKFSLDTPLEELSPELRSILFYGSDEKIKIKYENRDKTGRYEYSSRFSGLVEELRRRYLDSSSQGIKEWLEQYMTQRPCSVCGGKRLRPEVLGVTIGDKNIHELCCLSVEQSLQFFEDLNLGNTEKVIAAQILKEIRARLSFMKNVGLNYLTLERRAATLSGGEAQRIRLATQIGSSLVGVLYILDEPSIGLHQRDNERLIATLKELRDMGNTLIVVEHDEQTLRAADYIVDMGPGAGEHGGRVCAEGPLSRILKNPDSLTGLYLSGKKKIPPRTERRQGSGEEIRIIGAREHNLKNLDISFPLGKFIAITGVSGSGKSTLLEDILYPALYNRINKAHLPEGRYRSLKGAEHIDKIINIDQSPIGRTPRSNPATYVGLFTPIRDLFASLPEAKARGYKPGRFSFNVAGGRCEHCEGAGTICIEMHFLPDVYITCEVCGGRRFNRDTLDIRYKGKNIADVLEMTVEEGCAFFKAIPAVRHKLETLLSVGLGYISLGQSALSLSGGEAQRVKLSLELSRKTTGRTFYILDEPTTGLHFEDVKKLLEVLHLLVDKGNTVVLIEHNMEVIRQADHIIDLGPEGGPEGGQIIASGVPEEVARNSLSHTGRYLQMAGL